MPTLSACSSGKLIKEVLYLDEKIDMVEWHCCGMSDTCTWGRSAHTRVVASRRVLTDISPIYRRTTGIS